MSRKNSTCNLDDITNNVYQKLKSDLHRSMLSSNEIFIAIVDKKVQVFYYFGRNDKNEIVQYNSEKYFSENELNYLYSDRLKLTMGRIVKMIGFRKVKASHRFKNNPHLFDLQKSNYTYVLRPKESIVILTNERVKFNGDYAAIIIPRISLSDVGIVITPAYIDPYYDGLLRIQLTNQSNNSFEVHTLEEIAQCFIFKLSSCAEEHFKENFKEKSTFFGQNWPSIIDSDRDPFPTKKGATENEESLKNRILFLLSRIQSLIQKHGLYVIIVSILVGFNLAQSKISNLEKFVDSFSASSGEITVQAGERKGSKQVLVHNDKSDIITVLYNNDKITYHIESGVEQGECYIIFEYSMDDIVDDDYTMEFKYTVVLESMK